MRAAAPGPAALPVVHSHFGGVRLERKSGTPRVYWASTCPLPAALRCQGSALTGSPFVPDHFAKSEARIRVSVSLRFKLGELFLLFSYDGIGAMHGVQYCNRQQTPRLRLLSRQAHSGRWLSKQASQNSSELSLVNGSYQPEEGTYLITLH